MDKDLILIDGSSFIFRAFHAMPNLTSPDKKPTGATYGITNMLKQMRKKYDTYNWCCVFDAPGKTFRHEIYPEYKANRADTPSELISQFEDIYNIIPALGIPIIIRSNVEADDVIGTLAIYAKNQGYNVLIATGDKDFAQLVQYGITLINTMNDEILDYNGVVDKFGVKPNQIVDYLTLIGDKVDNVPGVDKCGPKTATKWLTEYNTLDNLLGNANQITGVVGDNLRKATNWLATGKNLITIRTDLDLTNIIPNGLEELTIKPENLSILSEIYAKLGFKTWLRQLNEVNQANHTNAVELSKLESPVINNDINLTIVKDKLHFKNILTNLKQTSIKINVLPDEINPNTIKFIFFSQEKDVYLAVNYQNAKADDLFNHENNSNSLAHDFIGELEVLLNLPLPKIFINYKDNLSLFKKNQLKVINGNTYIIDDITLLHYTLNSKLSHTIQYIYKDILGMEPFNLIELFANIQLNDKELQLCNQQLSWLRYADVIVNKIKSRLDIDELDLYAQIELPLVAVLVDIEYSGIKLDVAQLKIIESEIITKLKFLEETIYCLASRVFNINSAKQLQDVLFNQLKLPVAGIKKNTNGYSTDEESLRRLSSQHIEIVDYLIQYRGLSKLLNTYISKLPPLVDRDSKLHTTFDQAVVASGRLSSKDPNLQNIPVKSDWGRKIRRCFIASNNHLLICADYSQIELRILAHFSQDENLINAFNTNQDIHSITAGEIFHKSITEITKDERRYAKTINFSLLYGKTIYGLATELDIDRATAKHYIDTYFAKYPKVLGYLEGIKDFARHNGYVQTLMGRKIYLSNINAGNKILREAEERVALNAPMQGTSADIIKIAMNRINNWLQLKNLNTKIILQVHDELILDVPNNEVNIIKDNLSNLMTSDFNKLTTKLSVDIKVATNWGDAH